MPIDDSGRDRLKGLLTARRLGHDANQLLIDILERWGGTKQFAHDLFLEFQEARPGSLIRQNILEMIQKLVVNNTNHNITKIVNPTDLEDDEIDEQLEMFAQRAGQFIHEAKNPTTPTATAYSAPWLQEDEPPPE